MFRNPATWQLVAAAGIVAAGLDARSIAADVAIETVFTDLRDPCSIPIRPVAANAAAYEVLIYDRDAGSVVSIQSDQPTKATKVITGLKRGDEAAALFALDSVHVVVSGSDAMLSMYELPALGEAAASEPIQQVAAAEEVADSTTRRVHAIARTRANEHVPDLLIVATLDENDDGQLWKIPIRADTLGELVPFASESKQSAHSIPALALSGQGFIVAAENPSDDGANVCHVTFYNPANGSPALRLPVKLRAMTGMAFSPVSGNLYVVGVTRESEQHAVYRIDGKSRAGESGCEAVKVVDIDPAAALAFGPDGALYFTAVRGAQAGESKGTLQKITGDL